MTSQNPPNGQNPPSGEPGSQQSLLAEAVEQLADSAGKWSKDITDFCKQQADRLSAGTYGLNDLVTAPVRLMKILVQDTFDTASVISDNISLLANPGAGVLPRDRTMRAPVIVPTNTSVTFVASDMVGRRGHTIPGSDFDISLESRGENPTEKDVVVKLRPSRVPNDTYAGFLRPAVDNPAIKEIPFAFAITEWGEPVP
ncbi:MAG: hypothetical protein ACRDRX_04045 [Pseudonocardiaceae bacterium]